MMEFECTIYNRGYLENIVTLWNENAEWGEITGEHWEQVFVHTPAGPSTVVIALEKETREVLAQFVFMPVVVHTQAGSLLCAKACAPIVKKSVREKAGLAVLMTFIYKMYVYGKNNLKERGYDGIYSMPDVRWARGLQLVSGMEVASFPLYLKYLDPTNHPAFDQDFTLVDIKPNDERINPLWLQFSTLYASTVQRNADCLSWKLSHRNYQYVGITRHGQLVGFAALLFKKEIKGIAICDTLIANWDCFQPLLTAIYLRALEIRSRLPLEQQTDAEKITILATPAMLEILKNNGFVKYNYRFAFAIQSFKKGQAKKDMAPENWYVSAND